jgi:hypothetical protein
MGVLDVMRVRLSRATEQGVPSRDFLRHELEHGLVLKGHINARLAQAGQETEDAVRSLEHELDTPEEEVMRIASRQMLGD